MPYKDKSDRNAKREHEVEKQRPGASEARAERQRARRKFDAAGKDRSGKDLAHVKALSKGGSNKQGVKLQAPSKNRSFPRNSDGSMK